VEALLMSLREATECSKELFGGLRRGDRGGRPWRRAEVGNWLPALPWECMEFSLKELPRRGVPADATAPDGLTKADEDLRPVNKNATLRNL